jgi:TPR repeat protein
MAQANGHRAFLLALLLACAPARADLARGEAAFDAKQYELALREFRAAAEAGNARALGRIGGMYRSGLGVKQDFAKAMEHYRRAAEQGDAWGLAGVGILHETGSGVGKDAAEALRWYRRAGATGDRHGQYMLGRYLLFADGATPAQMQEGIAELKKSAGQGEDRARVELGLAYYAGRGVPKDPVASREWLRQAAESGDADGQYQYAMSLRDGDGGDPDPAAAARWFGKSAAQGKTEAEGALGQLYIKGSGVPQDVARGMALYRKAAEAGDAEAQLRLGAEYYRGKHVARDLDEAVRWLRKSAEAGEERAITLVASVLLVRLDETGEGDLEEAVGWATAAAEKGSRDAQFQLGLLYFGGKGVEQDRARAAQLFRDAAKQGHEGGQCMVDAGMAGGDGTSGWADASDADKLRFAAVANSEKCRPWGLTGSISVE